MSAAGPQAAAPAVARPLDAAAIALVVAGLVLVNRRR
jgi:hypothetical protein